MDMGGKMRNVTIESIFIWCDYKGRDYRERSTVLSVDTKFYGLSQIMGYYRFNPVCVIRVDRLKMLWVITGYGVQSNLR